MMPQRSPSLLPTTLSIVVPCYNEQEVLAHTYARLARARQQMIASGSISRRSEIVLVDDGSRDDTWKLIDAWAASADHVVGVKLSRNCGHQNALLAGMESARGDAVVTIDADLQDDIAAIAQMVEAFQAGHEVVYGVRSSRACDSWFKRTSARGFYHVMSWLGVQTVFDHADYRLLSRRAVAYLREFNEANLFLRGVVPLLGLRSTVVRYERHERLAGESKYPLRKMLEFALNGITSFSVRPLRVITGLGFAVSIACVALAAWALGVKVLTDSTVPGWASTILPIYFLGGVQLFCVGVLGEYIGKIYVESKRRPRFLVEMVARADAVAAADALPLHVVANAPRRPAARAARFGFAARGSRPARMRS